MGDKGWFGFVCQEVPLLNIENRKCDVLVVGGGIAGMMAAIRAAEQGAKVIVAEKANTLRSGAAGYRQRPFSLLYTGSPRTGCSASGRGDCQFADSRRKNGQFFPHLPSEVFRYREAVGQLGYPHETPRKLGVYRTNSSRQDTIYP